jgi:hypothetical protein
MYLYQCVISAFVFLPRSRYPVAILTVDRCMLVSYIAVTTAVCGIDAGLQDDSTLVYLFPPTSNPIIPQSTSSFISLALVLKVQTPPLLPPHKPDKSVHVESSRNEDQISN